MSAATTDRPRSVNERTRPRHGFEVWAQRYALLVAFVAVLVFFTFFGPTSAAFPTEANVVTVLGNQAVGAIIAIAITIPLTARVLDLSVGATTGLSSIVTAAVMSKGLLPAWAAIVLGVGIGALVGLVNGMLLARFQLDPIIETLAIGMLITGLTMWYTGGTPITGNLPKWFVDFGSLNWMHVPRLMFVLVPVAVLAWYLTEQTPFGRGLAAIGSNRRAASLVGIRVDRSVCVSLVLSGTLAGVAGVLLTARAGSADTQTGPSYLFPALAAVFLGATTIRPGQPNVLGTVVGAFFVAFTVSGLTIAGKGVWAPSVFNGAALLVALLIMAALERRRARAGQQAMSSAGSTDPPG